MNAWPNATHIGLSATPWRLDGSGLDDCFDELIPGPSTSWLMDEGTYRSTKFTRPRRQT